MNVNILLHHICIEFMISMFITNIKQPSDQHYYTNVTSNRTTEPTEQQDSPVISVQNNQKLSEQHVLCCL